MELRYRGWRKWLTDCWSSKTGDKETGWLGICVSSGYTGDARGVVVLVVVCAAVGAAGLGRRV